MSIGERSAVNLARAVLGEVREEIVAGAGIKGGKTELFDRIIREIQRRWDAEERSGTRRVINATGVVVHTNLGRAPLSEAARNAIADAAGYCALEYDVLEGKRGKRGARAETLLAELTGAERVLIVNNCAAAAFFVLTAFAAGGEVVISRGELVEIGGDFRVPDVLTQSGATLCEVGTTNRTKLADYEKGISAATKLILRVHPSNYKIVGFTAMPTLAELSELAHRNGILIYEDIGSGAIIDMARFGIPDEPAVRSSIEAGVDLVSFSGDKLLGGPQAGIIAGKAEYIDQLRKHPLYRALRLDKIAYAALESTLEAYRREAFEEIPVLSMFSASAEEIERRATGFIAEAKAVNGELNFEIVDGSSAVGGGAAPTVTLKTALIAISHPRFSASRLEFKLRNARTPIITRIVDDHVVIDLRTVMPHEEAEIISTLVN